MQRRQHELELAEIKRSREVCKSLSGFIREAWHIVEPHNAYIHNWHIDAVAKHLEAITFGTFLEMGLPNHVIFNQPPGTMKSLEVSVFWQAYEWGPCNMPGLRYLSTSYSDKYVTRDCRKTRDLILSDWYQKRWPHVRLVRVGETSFENTERGTREGVPFGSLTGGRGDRLCIDDPHSTETAESDTERETTTRILRESVPSRVNDLRTSAIIIMMQRLHGQDVTGVALELDQGYIHLRLPMEFESEPDEDGTGGPCITPIFTDPRTEEGELLFPAKFPPAEIERLKKSLGTYGTAGQLQQRPTQRGGGLFKKEWFRVVDVLPARPIRWVRGWDLAGTAKKKSPYTCGLRLGIFLDEVGGFIIADVVRGQLSPQKAEELIVNTATQDGPTVTIDIPQDPGQAGKSQVRYLVKALIGFTIRWSPETGSKEDRARPASSQAEAGNMLMLRGAWNAEFLDEVSSFPKGQFKDQVDALSRAFSRLMRPDATEGVPMGPRIIGRGR